MNLQTILMLYDYNAAAHRQVWNYVMKLTDEQYHQPLDYSVGSIHDQMVHMMAAEHLWFSRLNGTSPDRLWNGSDFTNRDAVRTQWEWVTALIDETLQNMTDETLTKDVQYNNLDGTSYTTPVIGVLLHVVNHATDHRAQTLAMIHTMGGETGPQDLIAYLRGHWDV